MVSSLFTLLLRRKGKEMNTRQEFTLYQVPYQILCNHSSSFIFILHIFSPIYRGVSERFWMSPELTSNEMKCYSSDASLSDACLCSSSLWPLGSYLHVFTLTLKMRNDSSCAACTLYFSLCITSICKWTLDQFFANYYLHVQLFTHLHSSKPKGLNRTLQLSPFHLKLNAPNPTCPWAYS